MHNHDYHRLSLPSSRVQYLLQQSARTLRTVRFCLFFFLSPNFCWQSPVLVTFNLLFTDNLKNKLTTIVLKIMTRPYLLCVLNDWFPGKQDSSSEREADNYFKLSTQLVFQCIWLTQPFSQSGKAPVFPQCTQLKHSFTKFFMNNDSCTFSR